MIKPTNLPKTIEEAKALALSNIDTCKRNIEKCSKRPDYFRDDLAHSTKMLARYEQQLENLNKGIMSN